MKVIVVGGGISGLATAWFLQHDHGVDVTLLEATESTGGKLRSAAIAGATIDVGADAFLARQPHVRALAERLGLGDELVAPATAHVQIWSRGRLRTLPAGTVLGVPTEVWPLLRSGVLTVRGALRAAVDLVAPRTPFDDDRSVGQVVARRFGREVVDVLVDPLLGGIYAGDPDALSVSATTPLLAEAAAGGRSLLLELRRRRRAAVTDEPLFLTLRNGGMARLAQALRDDLAHVRTGATVDGLGLPRGGVAVGLVDGAPVTGDAAVLAVPTYAAANVVEALAPAVAASLRGVDYASVATVALAYRRADVGHPLDGSGLLVPGHAGRTVKAATFVSSKWPHHAADDRIIIRASVGRAGQPPPLATDADLVTAVHDDLVPLLDLADGPIRAAVTMWPRSLPQPAVGHIDLVAAVRRDLLALGPVHVVGAGYDGVGVASCVAAAERLAAAIAS